MYRLALLFVFGMGCTTKLERSLADTFPCFCDAWYIDQQGNAESFAVVQEFDCATDLDETAGWVALGLDECMDGARQNQVYLCNCACGSVAEFCPQYLDFIN